MMSSGVLTERRHLVTDAEERLTVVLAETLHRFMRQHHVDEHTARRVFAEAMQEMAHHVV